MFKKILLSSLVVVATLIAGGTTLSILNTLTQPAFPGGSRFVGVSMWNDGFVSATGSWTMLNDRPADPIQSSEIRCYMAMGICIEAVAKLGKGKYLAAELYVRKINDWTQDRLSYTENALCVVIDYTIDRVTSQVTGNRMSIKPMPEGCSDMRQTDLSLVLTDGFEIWKQERARETPWTWIGFLEALLLVLGVYVVVRIWRSPRSNAPALAVRA